MEIPAPERPLQNTLQPALAQAKKLIRVEKARERYGVDGAGLTVAVLDTGIRATHQHFVGRITQKRNFTGAGSENDVADANGHGTNVTGIIASSLNGDTGGGVAPAASIVSAKVLGQAGGTFDWISQALKWILDHPEFGVSVVCMSLGNERNHQDDQQFRDGDLVGDYIRQLTAKNVAVVIAAGNGYYRYQTEGMSYPAILRESVSVGAVYDAAEGVFRYESGAEGISGPDVITPFSQRLHPALGRPSYTTVFAPGAPITSTGSESDTALSTQHGTSQAAPVICGVILLLQQLYRKETSSNGLPSIDVLKECLRNGVHITDGDDERDNVTHTGKVFARVDAVAALEAMKRLAHPHAFFMARFPEEEEPPAGVPGEAEDILVTSANLVVREVELGWTTHPVPQTKIDMERKCWRVAGRKVCTNVPRAYRKDGKIIAYANYAVPGDATAETVNIIRDALIAAAATTTIAAIVGSPVAALPTFVGTFKAVVAGRIGALVSEVASSIRLNVREEWSDWIRV